MGAWKIIFGLLFTLIILGLMLFYWFIPFKNVEFNIVKKNSNFSIGSEGMESMQIYPNMRYPTPDISYSIEDSCSLNKKDDMERAFEIMENITVLNFYPVQSNEEIYVSCEEGTISTAPGFFLAGEGGPTEVVLGDKFSVIPHGEVNLIRSSQCPNPNIAIHELLHALGFEHSTNENNIMYEITKCSQTIGDDIPELLNKLYSVPSYADLTITNITAEIDNRYLDANITIKNAGLIDSGYAELDVYTDDKLIKQYIIKPLKAGEGLKIIFGNLLITKINVKELNFVINASFNELEKENNKITLEVKNN